MANKQINALLSDSGPLVAIFDLDGTLTKKDTYIPFLLFILKHRPIRIFYVSIHIIIARFNASHQVSYSHSVVHYT